MLRIPFNKPPFIGKEIEYVNDAIHSGKLSGDGQYTKKCHEWLQNYAKVAEVLLTTSGTHALEMAALLCEIEAGDEVILPSFTFSSTANAFVLAGAKLVFVDIRPDTMNIDENKIEAAITDRTKVIAPVHYAGVGCEMDKIMSIATKYGLMVVEDAAQAVKAYYKGIPLGSIGDFGCFSFHETKNYSMGEGGALLIRDGDNGPKAEILREKGTNRTRFLRGQIDKYTWVDYGSSYLPSELNAAYLLAELEEADVINNARMAIWNRYYQKLGNLEADGKIEIAHIPEQCSHNAHLFWIKAKNIEERTDLITFLRDKGIYSAFHYIPLHSADAGIKFGRFNGVDEYTTKESERLTRLPLYYGLSMQDVDFVIECIYDFYSRL